MLKRNDRTFAVPDTRGRGRSRKTWTECVVYDLRFFDIRFLAINTLTHQTNAQSSIIIKELQIHRPFMASTNRSYYNVK